MKKLLILFILISACGYQPIYNADLIKIEFNKINLTGDTKINRKLISLLGIKEVNNEIGKQISIYSSGLIEETSKDAKGQPATYRTNITITVEIKEQNKLIKSKSFNEDFSYNNIENKFDLSVYQKDVEDNLIKKITDDIIIFINL
tara:strand:+ start:215 stop:652 length:438 start_codon:yes stop_codon:yes gene_type:complete